MARLTVDDFRVTRHAKKRMKQRLGISKKSTDRIAQDAIINGITQSEAKSGLKKYMQKVFLSHNTGVNLRVYHQKVFVFTSNFVLITILQLPQELFKYEKIALEERRKNKQKKKESTEMVEQKGENHSNEYRISQ